VGFDPHPFKKSAEVNGMSDQSRAREILIHTRSILAERMSAMIMVDECQLLADAEGNSSVDEIGNLFKRVGSRLSLVNTMLASLPAVAEAPQHVLLVPAPEQGVARARPVADSVSMVQATFKTFFEDAARGEVNQAANSLTMLLGIELEEAQGCTLFFRERLATDPGVLGEVMRLREELRYGRDNSALLILASSFGLTGFDTINVLQKLKDRFIDAA
jgi:hypothetical protein